MTPRFILYLILLICVSLLGLLNFKKLSSPYKLLTVFVLITFLSESLTRYFAKEYRNSFPVYHVYYPLHYFFITSFYIFFLRRFKAALSWSWVALVALALFNIIFFQSPFQFTSNIVLVCSIIYIFCSLLLFKNMLNHTDETPLLKQGLFWYNTSTLIIYIFTFFCWSFYNILLKANSTDALTTIIYFLGMQYYLVTGIAIYLDSSRHKKKEVSHAG